MKPHNHSENENQKRALEQAKAAYQNAQEIIRFIDTKTSFITGASTLSIGFVLDALKEYIQLPDGLKNNFDLCPIMTCWIAVLAILSLLGGVLCLWSSIMSLIGRLPKKFMDHHLTILFPYFSGKQSEQDYCKKITTGFAEEEIAREYQTQVWNAGLILHKKLTRHRWAARMLLLQLVAITMAGILVIFCLYYGYVFH
jgi:hypothetical protein